jgi:hypothetical protein
MPTYFSSRDALSTNKEVYASSDFEKGFKDFRRRVSSLIGAASWKLRYYHCISIENVE